jgi:hypothetical protein
MVPDMFCNFYLLKIHKIGNESRTIEPKEKASADLKSLESKKNFDVCCTKLNLKIKF